MGATGNEVGLRGGPCCCCCCGCCLGCAGEGRTRGFFAMWSCSVVVARGVVVGGADDRVLRFTPNTGGCCVAAEFIGLDAAGGLGERFDLTGVDVVAVGLG